MTVSEDDIQAAIVRALRLALPHGWIVQSTANKPRSAIAGAREKRMGAIAGWPDVTVLGLLIDADPINARPFTGFIEVKTRTGRVRPEQHNIHDRLRDCGFPVAVARSVDDALEIAREWGLPLRIATPVRREMA